MRPIAAVALAAFLAAPAPRAQGPVVAPGENLVVEGVPPIPAALADEVRRYTEFRSAGFSGWHPTERSLLIATRFGDTPQLHRVAAPMGAREQLTFFDEPVNGGGYEPREGRYVVFARDVGGNEFTQLYRLDLADGRVTLLTDGAPRSQNTGGPWSTAGDRIAYGSTRRNGADRDLYVMDPADPSTDRLLAEVSGGGWAPLDWSPDDRRLVVSERLSVNESRLWLFDAATGAREELTRRGPEPVAYGGARFAPDGRGLYTTSDRGGEFRRLVYLDLATREETPLTAGLEWDVEGFDVTEDGRRVAFAANEGGTSRLYLLDVASGAYAPIGGLPAGVVGGLQWHRRTGELAFSVASARSPSDVYSLDVSTGALTRWTASELGGLNAGELAEPERVRWTSFDGREISGFLYRPPARFAGRRPVVIDIHGGPEIQARAGFIGRANYFVNELGVARIYPNVRGSAGFGKTFLQLDNGPRREDPVRDVGALLDWIARQPDLDPERVMVTGGSYGGYMTLAVATTYPDRIRAALDVVGISDFRTFLRNTEAYRRDLRRVEYGDERDPEMAAFFARTAPLENAGRITRPLFVVQGANDPRVPRSEAEQMVARVRQNGTPVWYLMARDEGHGFQKKPNVDYQFYATVLFMREHLLSDDAGAAR